MRKSRYGPLRCDTCELVLSPNELGALQRARASATVHLGCMTPINRTRVLVRIGGTRCLFCGRALLLPDLVEHFNARHGRTLVNW